MTVLTFPSNPIEGQQYAAPNGIQYVFDSVKWIVETTSSSSSAVTNSTQDRVAPMFVDGDNTGITFSYNAATNTMSAAVTSVNGDSLINGSNEAVLNSDGSITLPTLTTVNWEDGTLSGPTLQMGNDPTVTEVVITGPTPTNDYSSARRLIIQGQQGFGGEGNSKGEGGDVYIWAGSGGDGGAIDPRGDGGDVKLRAGQGGNNGGYIRLESGDALAENGTGGFLDLNAGNASNTGGYGGHVNIRAGNGAGDGSLTGGNVRVYTNSGGGTWEFKPDGSFALNNNEVHIATNNWGITAPVSVNTVVYTAKQSNLASIRVHATIEGAEDGDTTGNHSQACDMMIVRRQSTLGVSTVDSVVYGVIYTGAGPLATLDAQWNALTSKIEITATPVSTTNNVYVKIYATEVARGD